MKNDFDPNLPIYIQVMEEIKKEIFASEYLPGSKLASVRELALEYGVNPNTIQKALSELERTGIVFIEEMRKLGFSKIEVIKMIEELD